MKVENALWVQNLGTSDVSLGDLGVKVPAGKTINIYKWNPYITVEQVEKSKTSGSLLKRLDSEVLKIVVGPVIVAPHLIDQIKESKRIVTAKKTKSSIIIGPESGNEEEGKKFDFADYGITDVQKIEKEKDSVLVNVRQDEEAIKSINSVGFQSKKIMEDFQQKAVDPLGPLAETSSPNNSFITVKPPIKSLKKSEELLPVKPEVKKLVLDNTIVVEQTDQLKPSNIVKDDIQESADKIIEIEKPKEEGMRVATRTEKGVIIMELKEEEPEKTMDKPVVKKVSKKK